MIPVKFPHSMEAEKRVLGACIRDVNALRKAQDILEASAFFQPNHQVIFRVLCDMAAAGTAIDLMTLADALEKSGDFEKIGGAYYLMELANSVATTVNVEHHAQIVKEKAIRRQLIRYGYQQIEDAENEDLDKLASKAYEQALSIVPPSKIQGFRRIDFFLERSIDQIQERIKRKRSGKPFKDVLTGVHDFDHRFGGLNRGELIILAARPSEGKTLLASQIALSVARAGNVGFVSMEMAGEEILCRSFSTAKGEDDKTTASLILQKANDLQKRNLYFDDSPGIRIDQLAARSERLKIEIGKLDLLVIDYLQLVRIPQSLGRMPTIERVTYISGEVKSLARRLNCPVFLLSQLSRECEKENRPPRLSDLRESGAIEQDADMVLFIHRPDGISRGKSGARELLIAKNRNGVCGKIDMVFSAENLAFHCLTDRDIPDDGLPF